MEQTVTISVPAQNLEAEESIIGAMLLSSSAIDAVREHVSAEDFYRDSHGIVFTVASNMHDRQLPVDAITVSDELERLGKLKEVGGPSRMHELAALTPATANAAHYATIVHEQAILRRLSRAGLEIGRLGSGDAPGTVEDLIDAAEEALRKATLTLNTASATPISEGLDPLMDDIRETCITGIPRVGAASGFDSLDLITQGLWPGQLILIAARTGQGKSTLALNIAENFADRGEPVLFVSLEMNKRELQIKSIAREGRLDSRELLNGEMKGKREKQEQVAAARALVERRTNLWVEDSGNHTIASLRAMTTRYERIHKIKLLVVDYLQLVTAPNPDHRLAIGEISRGLKMLAMRLNIPIIALCQLNREGAKARPELWHLKESSSLEQDADMVIFLHDPAGDESAIDATADGIVDVIVAKNRRGARGDTKLDFIGKYSSFLTRRNQNGDLA